MGALYHHFSSKEALFRAILGDNISRGLDELGSAMANAPSFHEAIQKFVSYFFGEFASRRELASLSVEFWALAAREPWAADVVGESIRQGRALIRQALTAACDAGFVRQDLDLESAATLLLATVEGIGVLCAVAPDSITAGRHAKSWTELIERFIQADGAGDLNEFQRRMAVVVRQGTGGTRIERSEHG
jgi:AcrR family transcriptional regulator